MRAEEIKKPIQPPRASATAGGHLCFEHQTSRAAGCTPDSNSLATTEKQTSATAPATGEAEETV
jgi:hypothetical protein